MNTGLIFPGCCLIGATKLPDIVKYLPCLALISIPGLKPKNDKQPYGYLFKSSLGSDSSMLSDELSKRRHCLEKVKE